MKILPQIFYGLHFAPGVAHYRPEGAEPYTVLINEDTAKRMDPTFPGKPVFVRHVNEVDLTDLQNEADGYVAESFFNELDGKHWVKFIVVSDKGQDAIRKGWRLSNAYKPVQLGAGGRWHGVAYGREITQGEYEHLAIVENPRYSESIVLTPEQFKKYNEEKQEQLLALKNSEEPKGDKMKFDWFKKGKVENVDEGLSVVLPKSKKEFTLAELITNADNYASGEAMADMTHKVKLHDGTMCNVGELLEKHKALHDALEEMKAKHPEEKTETPQPADKGEETVEEETAEVKEAKARAAQEAEAKQNAEKIKNEEEKAKAKLKAKALINAELNNQEEGGQENVDLSMDRTARGKALFGSSN